MYNPKMLRQGIDDLRSQLEDNGAPFGVDLAIPQIGGGARKTNVRPEALESARSLCWPSFILIH
jgi:hypothetical protein